MNVTYTLTDAEVAALEFVTAKANAGAASPVTPSAYLTARIGDVLASYQQEVVRHREADNRALIVAALALPESDRNEITALIRSKLNQ